MVRKTSRRVFILILVSGSVQSNAQDKYFGLRVWCEKTKWKPHIDWMLGELMACSQSDPANDQSPCNRFVGKALERVWGLSDFRNGAEYLTANDIAAYLSINTKNWRFMGTASNQDALASSQAYANDSVPVVAVMAATPEGHVALIIPGELTYSAKWQTKVPNSANFSHKHASDPLLTYVGKRLSYAFTADVRTDVKLYSRNL